jgi:hypothetical protein
MKLPRLTIVGSHRPERARLRDAISARDAKLREIVDARETLERLSAVIHEADQAARDAARAASKASESRAEWVGSGCAFSGSRALESLDQAAAEAAQVAQKAALNASAVNKGLGQARSRHESMQYDMRGCEAAITAARGAVIFGEEQEFLEDLKRDAAAVFLKARRAHALHTFLLADRSAANRAAADAVWGLLYASFFAPANEFRGLVERSAMADVEELMRPLRQRAEALRENPEL